MQPSQAKILLADDEPQIRRFVKIALHASGYEMIESGTGQEAITLCATSRPDLIILDLGLPDMDGKKVLSHIREWNKVPVIILSVRSNEKEKIELLDAGADDYVTKPFSVSELVSRVRMALHHHQLMQAPMTEFTTGNLSINLQTEVVMRSGKPISLSKKEYQILALLTQSAGLIVTHGQLLKQVWGEGYAKETESLRVFIRQLRQKIEDNPTAPRYIITESGIGYRLHVLE